MLKHTAHAVTLPSGLQGIIIDTPKTGVVVAEISFRAGEFLLKREKWETAHLMEHVLLGANKDFPKARDFQAAIEQNGAYSNAYTSPYDITYEVEAADFEWERVVGLLCDAISHPKFLQEEFDSEMSNVREELISRGNNHFRHLNLALRQAMGLMALTDQERVELMHNVTRRDLIAHYKQTHTLRNCRFIVAGDFKGRRDEILNLLKKRLQLEKGSERIEMPRETVQTPEDPLVLRKPSVPNIYLYLDMYIPRIMTHHERDVLSIVSTMLTETMYSRIFGTAREKGWVYGMGSGAVMLGEASGWWLGAQVSKTNSQPLMRLIRDELQRLKHGEIDEPDFDAARKHLLGKVMRSGQTASGLVSSYTSYYHDGIVPDLNRRTRQLEKITSKEASALFKELCDANSWGIGGLGSISLVPARKLHSYASEIFADAG